MKSLVPIVVVAAGTMLAALAVFYPTGLTAVDSPKIAVANPKITVDGCEFSVLPGKEVYDVGEKPTLSLYAVNTTDKPKSVTVKLQILSRPTSNPMSRMPVRTTALWQKDYSLSLAGGESRVVPIETNAALTAVDAFVSLGADKQSIQVPLKINAPATQSASQAPQP
jgi:hypothetical protein